MKLQKLHFMFLALFLFCRVGFSQNQALSKIDKEDMKRYLTFISSDSLQGRSLKTEVNGLEITANYIAETMEKLGVKPAGKTYFQKVELESSESDNENTYLKIFDNNGELVVEADSVLNLQRNASNIQFAGEIVIAGFGWNDKTTGYDDFAGIDLKDKIVMFAAGTPAQFKTGDAFKWNSGLEVNKRERAIAAGAAGIIVINSPNDRNVTYRRIDRFMNRSGYTLKSNEIPGHIKGFIFTTLTVADNLLGGAGKFENYLSGISKENEPNSFIVENILAKAKITTKKEPVEAQNVVVVIEGSDPKLKNEYLVYMAHYDHLGIGNDGDVYNGADDNGSGTVTLMELAEAFQSLDKKPKRSVVFLWVTCEEIGMFGSRYYTENPLFPLEKTVACINIDMDGRVFEPRDTVWNKSPKRVKDFNGLFTLSNNIWPGLIGISDAKCKELSIVPDKSLPSYFLRASDHYNFHNKGVPVLNYATGYHADYHKVSDEVSKINFDKMKRVTDLCFLVGYEIANSDKIEFERVGK